MGAPCQIPWGWQGRAGLSPCPEPSAEAIRHLCRDGPRPDLKLIFEQRVYGMRPTSKHGLEFFVLFLLEQVKISMYL